MNSLIHTQCNYSKDICNSEYRIGNSASVYCQLGDILHRYIVLFSRHASLYQLYQRPDILLYQICEKDTKVLTTPIPRASTISPTIADSHLFRQRNGQILTVNTGNHTDGRLMLTTTRIFRPIII